MPLDPCTQLPTLQPPRSFQQPMLGQHTHLRYARCGLTVLLSAHRLPVGPRRRCRPLLAAVRLLPRRLLVCSIASSAGSCAIY